MMKKVLFLVLAALSAILSGEPVVRRGISPGASPQVHRLRGGTSLTQLWRGGKVVYSSQGPLPSDPMLTAGIRAADVEFVVRKSAEIEKYLERFFTPKSSCELGGTPAYSLYLLWGITVPAFPGREEKLSPVCRIFSLLCREKTTQAQQEAAEWLKREEGAFAPLLLHGLLSSCDPKNFASFERAFRIDPRRTICTWAWFFTIFSPNFGGFDWYGELFKLLNRDLAFSDVAHLPEHVRTMLGQRFLDRYRGAAVPPEMEPLSKALFQRTVVVHSPGGATRNMTYYSRPAPRPAGSFYPGRAAGRMTPALFAGCKGIAERALSPEKRLGARPDPYEARMYSWALFYDGAAKLKLDPQTLPEGGLLHAWSLLILGQVGEARTAAAKILAGDGNSFGALLVAGLCGGEGDAAHFRRAFDIAPAAALETLALYTWTDMGSRMRLEGVWAFLASRTGTIEKLDLPPRFRSMLLIAVGSAPVSPARRKLIDCFRKRPAPSRPSARPGPR